MDVLFMEVFEEVEKNIYDLKSFVTKTVPF